MTRLIKDAGCLASDDRVDVLAIACAYWAEYLARDTDKAAQDTLDEALRWEMEAWNTFVIGGTGSIEEPSWLG